MEEGVAPKKIGGWLIVYFISLIVGAIILINNLKYIVYPLRSIHLTFYLFIVILIILLGTSLIRLKKSFIKFNIAYLWVTALIWLRSGISFFQFEGGAFLILIMYFPISLSWAIIWTIYFLRSKRVKETLIN